MNLRRVVLAATAFLPSIGFGQTAAEQQKAGEHDVVGVDNPLEARGIGVQVLGDERQRHVGDGDVDRRGEGAQADDGERQAPSSIV